MPTYMKFPARVVSATRARQGRMGRHVLWVLLVSTALAALALFGAWTLHAPQWAGTRGTERASAAEARSFDTGAPVAKQKSPDGR